MKKFHQLIAAIDFTPACRVALKEAVTRASQDGAAITALHVMDDYLIHELTKALSLEPAQIVSEWTERLRKFVTDCDVGAENVRCEVRIGRPFTEIAQFCKAHEADLLVMGAKGSKDEPGRIGAIAAKCIRKAPVDVLVVREDAQAPHKKIVTCVDFSENSAKAVQHALHLATLDGGSVDCLHVYQSAIAMSLDYGGFMPAMPAAIDPQALANWQKQLEDFLKPITAEKGSVSVTPLVVERMNVRETILEHVESTGATLVVLGTRGKTGLREFLIGTTAEKIVQHAPCSILAVKPDGFDAPAD